MVREATDAIAVLRWGKRKGGRQGMVSGLLFYDYPRKRFLQRIGRSFLFQLSAPIHFAPYLSLSVGCTSTQRLLHSRSADSIITMGLIWLDSLHGKLLIVLWPNTVESLLTAYSSLFTRARSGVSFSSCGLLRVPTSPRSTCQESPCGAASDSRNKAASPIRT